MRTAVESQIPRTTCVHSSPAKMESRLKSSVTLWMWMVQASNLATMGGLQRSSLLLDLTGCRCWGNGANPQRAHSGLCMYGCDSRTEEAGENKWELSKWWQWLRLGFRLFDPSSQFLLNESHHLANASTIAGDSSIPSPGGRGNKTGYRGNGYAIITPQ